MDGMTIWDNASEEPLEIIEANECRSMEHTLATKRFRRLFNELHALKAENERLTAARSHVPDSGRES